MARSSARNGREKAVFLPMDLQAPPNDQELDSKFAERPLLVYPPGDIEWTVQKDDSVSIFLPIDSDQGLAPKGTLIDANNRSDLLFLAQSFFLRSAGQTLSAGVI